jgi:hypothetical protein
VAPWANIQYSIDTQDPSSYSPFGKKEFLINHFFERKPAEHGWRVNKIPAKPLMMPLLKGLKCGISVCTERGIMDIIDREVCHV